MTDPGFDKLPEIIQWGLTAGAMIAGTLAFLFGRKNRPTNTDEVSLRELDRLQQESILNVLRRDLEDVIRATREAHENRFSLLEKEVRNQFKEIDDEMHHELDALEERLRTVELELARLMARPIRR